MKKNVIINIISLYGVSIAKIIFPLLVLPYLTRVLSVESYGTVSYVKTLMTYFQVFIDFGFLLSGTKDIVNVKKNKSDMSKVIGEILLARLILSIFAFGILVAIIFIFPILKDSKSYTLLAFIPVFLTLFLFDYVFRGIEKMQIIAKRFFLMKTISTCLTFIFVKNDSDIIWIPILDIVSSGVAIIMILFSLKKLGVVMKFPKMKAAIEKLKQSSIYFSSNMATTIFSALNTVIIGFILSKEDVAFWSLCIQIISTIQALYSPIIDGVYPSMIRTKEFHQIKIILLTFMPIILCGCIIIYFTSPYILLIIGGDKYVAASTILQLLIPILFFGFPAMLFGWPALGAINLQKKVMCSTVLSSLFQIMGLILLGLFGRISLITISIIRSITEVLLFLYRAYFCFENRKLFN